MDDGLVDDPAHALTRPRHPGALVTAGGERGHHELDGRPLETAAIALSGVGDGG